MPCLARSQIPLLEKIPLCAEDNFARLPAPRRREEMKKAKDAEETRWRLFRKPTPTQIEGGGGYMWVDLFPN
jgi:hypothetical protein